MSDNDSDLMLGNILREVTSLLDRRFLINAFFPSLIFWSLLITVGFVRAGNLLDLIKFWNQQDATLKVIQIIGFIGWITYFSSVLKSQLNTILSFYIGYWNFPQSRDLNKISKSLYQERLKQLSEKLNQDTKDTCYEKIYLRYPLFNPSEEVISTRLDNILKNADLYSKLRYEIDAVLIWPPLYNQFPEGFVQTITVAKSGLDFLLNISLLSGLFAILSGAYLLVVGASWWLFLVCFWGGLLVAWLAYQGALGNPSSLIWITIVKKK